MRWVAVSLALAVAGAAPGAAGAATPSNQTLVFYNARIALREDRPNDVLKLWLLRNALANRGEPGGEDGEFRSVVWAALGKLGLCQDGIPEDETGAGLWPLALHNYVLHSMTRGPPPTNPSPWDAFAVSRQQRFVSLQDVLDADELRSVTFFRTNCARAYTTLLQGGAATSLDLNDRIVAATFLQQLLERSRRTLARSKVEDLAVIETRIFDLDLTLAQLRARRARSEGRTQAQRARGAGVSKEAAAEIRERASKFPERSPQAAFLRRSLTWTPKAWLSLSEQRRLFLFKQAQPLSLDKEAERRLVLAIIDELIAQRRGAELQAWIGFLDAGGSADVRWRVISGDRGARLLELEPSSGFPERAVIALHRGVALMEEGKLQDSLRSFAYAMRHAEESTEASSTLALSRRWLSYALSRYESTDEVVATLKSLVPRQDYNAVIEDLVWRAAMRADLRSFERVSASVRPGTALDARIERLRTLARGNPGELATQLRGQLGDEPYSVLRFARALVENLEGEDPDVRRAQVPTMKLLIAVLAPVAENPSGKPNAHARTSAELIDRTQAILEGLRQLDDTGPGRARSLSPQRETFAGSIRLVPADALPWPFVAPEPEAPSAFEPIALIPIEWLDSKGARVFGWRITE